MQIETVCNTPDDVLFANIEENSKRPIPWVKSEEPHDLQAVIVGGGPSVKDWLHEIKYRKSQGQTIFALNGAAKYLKEYNIDVDYTVIVDARESNIQFIGYSDSYLLASQCHPSLFDKAMCASLWHQEYPDDMERFDSCLPPNSPEHALIGGGTTVGLSCMALVYALGYRKIHLYGYDSSYVVSETHAYRQYDPQCVNCVVTVAGKSFSTSLAMARQAELFPQLSDTLIDNGCLITLRGDGLLPWTSKMSALPQEPMSEIEKYEKMWQLDAYRKIAPGEEVAEKFVEIAGIKATDCVIDFGCGTGRGARKVHELTGCDFILMDFVEHSLDADIAKQTDWYTRVRRDLTKPIDVESEYGYCTDVMEHIPPDQVDSVLNNIMRASKRVFFQISLIDDVCGSMIGQKLHLSVHPFEWWIEKFKALGYHIEWAQDGGESAMFYVANP
jgi:hypothetical protein